MAYADGILQGSFRGAAFNWTEADAGLGRRVVKHGYPLRDAPYAEDLGRAAREFTLSVFVNGANWQADRDALITACETAGPGTLVHPLFGRMRVQATTCQVREVTEELGVARFQITFIEAGSITFAAVAVAAPGANTVVAATGLQSASQASFGSNFTISGSPTVSLFGLPSSFSLSSFVGQAAAGDLTTAFTQVKSALATVRAYSDQALDIENEIDFIAAAPLTALGAPLGLGGTIGSLIASVSFAGALAGNVGNTLATSWSDLFAGRVTPSYDEVNQVIQAQIGLAGFGLTALPNAVTAAPAAAASSPDRLQQAQNRAAFTALVRQAALAEAAQGAVAAPYSSSGQAIAMRDLVAGLLDAEAMSTTDGTVYQALSSLRIAFV